MQKMLAREKLSEMYLEALHQDQIPWRQNWKNYEIPFNASTGKHYQGINNLILSFVANARGYADPRWMTFNQAKKLGYSIKPAPENMKGDYGVKIEYWAIYDPKTKRNINFKEYEKIEKEDPERADKMKLVNRVSTVFNAEQINGIPKYVKQDIDELEFELDDAMENMIENMHIEINKGGNNAAYIPDLDKIIIPEERQFISEYDYKSTLLHELAHSTGHESRLNRNIKNVFGSEEYAKEELRAEIASSFLCQEFHMEASQENLDNHKAYIQSWIKVLEKDPNELFKSIKDANEISNYMIQKADLELMKDRKMELQNML